MSASPRSSAGRAVKASPARTSMSTCGQAWRNRSSAGSSQLKQAWHSIAMCIRPTWPRVTPRISASAASTSGSTCRASASSRIPAGDSRIGRVWRRNSGVPACSSIART